MVAYFNAWPIFCHKVALVACFLACLEKKIALSLTYKAKVLGMLNYCCLMTISH